MKLQGTEKVFDKTQSDEGAFFTKMPSNLFNYVNIPGYLPEYNFLYIIIVDYYNAELGYAYPTSFQISRKYGLGERTVRRHIAVLVDVGLIKVKKGRRNNRYIPFVPLSKEELFRKCPEAKVKYLEEIKKEDAEYKRERINTGHGCPPTPDIGVQ